MAIDIRYKRYGFHRYRKQRKYSKSDYVKPDETNWDNKRIIKYKDCTIFIEWRRGFYIKSDYPYISCYIFDSEDKYIAEYCVTFEDIERSYKTCTEVY